MAEALSLAKVLVRCVRGCEYARVGASEGGTRHGRLLVQSVLRVLPLCAVGRSVSSGAEGAEHEGSDRLDLRRARGGDHGIGGRFGGASRRAGASGWVRGGRHRRCRRRHAGGRSVLHDSREHRSVHPAGCRSKRRSTLEGPDSITVPAGMYTLTITGAGDDAGVTGDLDVTGADDLTITGAGAGGTVIDAAGVGDRVLDAPDPQFAARRNDHGRRGHRRARRGIRERRGHPLRWDRCLDGDGLDVAGQHRRCGWRPVGRWERHDHDGRSGRRQRPRHRRGTERRRRRPVHRGPRIRDASDAHEEHCRGRPGWRRPHRRSQHGRDPGQHRRERGQHRDVEWRRALLRRHVPTVR